MALPDFVVIGAMKCGTSTLQAQLAAQPGVFMCEPKEPNFFSDDDVFARGLDWYESLFEPAAPGDLKGEASTHYAKLPTHPRTVERLAAVLPAPRLVYMIRDPLERLVSHYMHDWSLGEAEPTLAEAVARRPELADYGRFGMQIAPWVERFGRDRILLTSLERLSADPSGELARVGVFLGLPEPAVWCEQDGRRNASAERIRRFPLYDLVVEHPAAAAVRRALVPKAVREALKRRLRMEARPTLPPDLARELRAVFSEDRAHLLTLLPEAAEVLPPEPEGAA